MNERFSVNQVHICTFDICQDDNVIKANLEESPVRWCVIDNQDKIAIDINQCLKYNYIETRNNRWLNKNTKELVKDNKRVAVFPYETISLDNDIRINSEIIIDLLKKGEEFVDGNLAFNNEEYLKLTNKEKSKKKIKSLFK